MTQPVLLAIDLAHRDSAAAALPRALSIARAADAPLHLAYVMAYGHYSYIEPLISASVIEDTAIRAKGDLDAMVAESGAPEGTVTTHVLRGGVSQQILDLADRIGAEHVIVNARFEAASNNASGPNAAQIARFAKCSVTILR